MQFCAYVFSCELIELLMLHKNVTRRFKWRIKVNIQQPNSVIERNVPYEIRYRFPQRLSLLATLRAFTRTSGGSGFMNRPDMRNYYASPSTWFHHRRVPICSNHEREKREKKLHSQRSRTKQTSLYRFTWCHHLALSLRLRQTHFVFSGTAVMGIVYLWKFNVSNLAPVKGKVVCYMRELSLDR